MSETKTTWPHIKVSIRFTNVDSKQVGQLCYEGWNMASQKVFPLRDLAIGFIRHLTEFYLASSDMDIDALNAELQAIAAELVKCKVERVANVVDESGKAPAQGATKE